MKNSFIQSVIFLCFVFVVIHCIVISPGSKSSTESNSIQHSTHINVIDLNQWGETSSRCVAILDKNKDLYFGNVKHTNKHFAKLGNV